MTTTQLMYIKAEEDDKEVLKKRITDLENENETLKQTLEQLQQLQGKCCDWCEMLMPNSDQERTTISNWLEGVLTALKSQRAVTELIIDDDDIQNSVNDTPPTPPPPTPPPPSPPQLPPPPPQQQQQQQQLQLQLQQPQSSVTVPNFTVGPAISGSKPTIVRGRSSKMKSLQIDYLKLKEIIRSADDRRGDKMKYLLNKLVDSMFTRDDLVAASGLGIRTHKDKHHTPLDRKKLSAIKDFLEEFAEKNGVPTMDPRTFRVTVGNKITNARRHLRNEFK